MLPAVFVTFPQVAARTARAKATSLVRETRAKMGDLKGKVSHAIAHAKAPHRSKSLTCSSETEIGLRHDTVTNASRYLGAVRAGHDEPSARSPSFAQLEIPGLEALLSVREENSEMG